MNATFLGVLFFLCSLATVYGQNVEYILIDDLEVSQSVTLNVGPLSSPFVPQGNNNTVTLENCNPLNRRSTIFGCSRSMAVWANATSQGFTSWTSTVSEGVWSLSTTTVSSVITHTAQWDAGDSYGTFDSQGLGGLDVTVGGLAQFLTVQTYTGFSPTNQRSSYQLTMLSTDGGTCQQTIVINSNLDAVAEWYFVNMPGTCDFTSIGAIQLAITAPSNANPSVRVSRVFIAGPAPPVSALESKYVIDSFDELPMLMFYQLNETVRAGVDEPSVTVMNGRVEGCDPSSASPSILGCTRSSIIQVVEGSPGTLYVTVIDNSVWSASIPSRGVSYHTCQWDGDDSATLNTTGLGGWDLSLEGQAVGLALDLTVDVPAVAEFRVTVWSASGNCTFVQQAANQTDVLLFYFSSLVGSCDVREAGAVEVTLSGPTADHNIQSVFLMGPPLDLSPPTPTMTSSATATSTASPSLSRSASRSRSASPSQSRDPDPSSNPSPEPSPDPSPAASSVPSPSSSLSMIPSQAPSVAVSPVASASRSMEASVSPSGSESPSLSRNAPTRTSTMSSTTTASPSPSRPGSASTSPLPATPTARPSSTSTGSQSSSPVPPSTSRSSVPVPSASSAASRTATSTATRTIPASASGTPSASASFVCLGFFTSDGNCVSQCPSGTYGATSGQCEACSSNCATCLGDAGLCTTCPRDTPLLVGTRCEEPVNTVTTPLNSTTSNTITSNSSLITVPENTFSEPASLQVAPVEASQIGVPEETRQVPRESEIVSINAVNDQGDSLQPQQPVQVCLPVASADTSDLCLAFINTEEYWECADDSLQAGANGEVCGETTHFTLFAILRTQVVLANIPSPSVSPTPSRTPTSTLSRGASASSSATLSRGASRSPVAYATLVPVPVPVPIPIPNPVPNPVPVPIPNPIPVPIPVPVPHPVPVPIPRTRTPTPEPNESASPRIIGSLLMITFLLLVGL